MSPSDRRREDLLERLLSGDLEPTSEEARTAFEGDPELRAAYDWIRGAERSLEAGVEFERDVLEEAARTAGETDEAFVRGVLEGELSTGTGGRSARRWRVLAAAAVALLIAAPTIWVVSRRAPDDERRAPDTLGAPVEGLVPEGPVEAYGPFTWRATLPPGGSFEVVVTDPEGRELARSPRLAEPRWDPGAAAGSWPEAIRWEVQVYDGTDRWLGSRAAEVRRGH